MRFDILTLFPNFFDSFLQESLLAKAQKKNVVKICVHNLRDWSADKHHTVDDKPYGGGPGMILKFEPIYRALLEISDLKRKKSKIINHKSKIVMLDPAGKQFDQRMAERFSKLDRLVLLCGRYEGFDHRVTKLADERVSIGPYVLNGGEAPAMVVIEAVARLVPGFVGKPESLREETFNAASCKLQTANYAEYPQYTRPEVVMWQRKKLRVPKVLLSGDHKKIAAWRQRHRVAGR